MSTVLSLLEIIETTDEEGAGTGGLLMEDLRVSPDKGDFSVGSSTVLFNNKGKGDLAVEDLRVSMGNKGRGNLSPRSEVGAVLTNCKRRKGEIGASTASSSPNIIPFSALALLSSLPMGF